MFNISTSLLWQLKFLACQSLSRAYLSAENDFATNKIDRRQHEALHVAHLCREIGVLAGKWQTAITSVSSGVTLSMSSVFTHQSPYVTWDNGEKLIPKCELADLLVAVIDKTSSIPTGRAILIQAKMSEAGTIRLSSTSEKNQFKLLAERPIFDVVTQDSPKKINLKSRSLPDSALLYGLATAHSALCYHKPYYCGVCYHPFFLGNWLVKDQLSHFTKLAPITASDCLGSIFLSLLQGSVGWKFSFPPPSQDWHYFSNQTPRDFWSELINYLLKNTFSKVLSKRHSLPANRETRGQEDVLCLSSNSPLNRKMAFFTTSDTDSPLLDYFADSDNAGTDWEEVNFQNWKETNGGFGEDSRGDADGFGEDGPISAIVIEVTRQH